MIVQSLPLHFVISLIYNNNGFVIYNDDDDCDGIDPIPILIPLVTSVVSNNRT